MQVGEVRVAEDADFEKLKHMCTCNDDWKQEINKNGVSVWTKFNDVSDFKLVKVKAAFKDTRASTVYDVLHDPLYRKTWDQHMIDGYEICCLNPNNDIGYYALKCPKPMKNRDFVTQRSWLDTGNEFLIVNHSVNHSTVPVKKNFVRGISYITGYLICPDTPQRPDLPGCSITYVTQSDPKGKLPVWLVNKASHILAPKIMKKLYKASKDYDAWKAKNQPQWKPWIFPEQIEMPRLDPKDILSMQETLQAEVINETDLKEEDVRDDMLMANGD